MNLDTILNNMLNGEPLHDAITIGIIFTCFILFYKAIFGAMFSIFNKN